MATVAEVAKVAQNIVDGVIDHQDMINAAAGFIPGMPMQAVLYAEKGLPAVRGALILIQQETGKSWAEAFADLISHLTAGQANSPILSPTVTTDAAAAAAADHQSPAG